MMKKFCVLTVGRAGSTSLMTVLEKSPDIAVPNKNISCVDNELVHPKNVQEYAKKYSELCGKPIATPDELIDGFFAHNASAAYAGFKTMPNRHKNLRAFAARTDIQFITLVRQDVASTVASFLLAMKTDSWRRSGEPQQARWKFDVQQDGPAARSNLAYVLGSLAQLGQVPNAIRLTYEDLCDPKFHSPALDGFFGRPVKLDNPRPPTSASEYVENWEEFKAFMKEAYRNLSPQAVRAKPAGSRAAAGVPAGLITGPIREISPGPTGPAPAAAAAQAEQKKQEWLAGLTREAAKHQPDFDGVQTYCMFIGYPRSGHSLIGSLLDAHPNIIIAHELDALKYARSPLTREQLFYLLLDNSKRFTAQGRKWEEYSYLVKNQWQGRFQSLRVIGDKKGGFSSVHLRREPGLLKALRDKVRTRIKFIHVFRNPYDNISTIRKKHETNLEGAGNMFFSMAQTVLRVKGKTAPEDWIDIRHEDFIEDPTQHLRRLCGFLGQDASEEYLKDCAAIVFKSPRKSRHDAPWTPELIQQVQKASQPFPFLDGYAYDEQ